MSAPRSRPVQGLVIVITVLAGFLPSLCLAQIEILKSWNGAAMSGRRAVVAVRTSTAIKWCNFEPTGARSRLRYSSDDNADSARRRGIGVTIEEQATLCKLIIDRAAIDDAGGYKVTVGVQEACQTGRRRRREAQESQEDATVENDVETTTDAIETTGAFDGAEETEMTEATAPTTMTTPASSSTTTNASASGKPTAKPGIVHTKLDVSPRRRVSQLGICDDSLSTAESVVQLVVESSGRLAVIAGQEEVFTRQEDRVVLTARVGELPTACDVSFSGRRVVNLDSRVRDGCAAFSTCGTVCADKFESVDNGIYACNVNVSRMTSECAGSWEITVGGLTGSARTTTNVRLIEPPRSLRILQDCREVIGLVASSGLVRVQCVADGGNPQPKFRLQMAGAYVSGKTNACPSQCNNQYCTEFELDLSSVKVLPNSGLTCAATTRGADAGASAAINLIDQQAGAGTLSLVSPSSSGNSFRVCASGVRQGDRLEVAVQVEARPKPDFVQWIMQEKQGSNIRINLGRSDREGRYESREVENADEADRYMLILVINRLDKYDIDTENNHVLVVDNGSELSLSFTIDTRNCGAATAAYHCDRVRDLNCRCDSDGGSRQCCDASPGCSGGTCCSTCANPRDADCNLCDGRNRGCVKLAQPAFQCDRVRDLNCRCDSDRMNRQCCDASPRCSGGSCCQSCSGSRDPDCLLCDSRNGDCMKLPSQSLSTTTAFQCNRLRDASCRCDSDSANRRCCDASSRCSGGDCCERCANPRDPNCNLCDSRSGSCMTLAQAAFQCDRARDTGCRCDSDGANRRCCDAGPRCSGDNCCGTCFNPRDADCNLCDGRNGNCMTLAQEAAQAAFQCDTSRDSNCRCDDSRGASRQCCDASPRCAGSDCCVSCPNARDPDCTFCDGRSRSCMKKAAPAYQCDRTRDVACRCDSDGAGRKCCDASRRCSGSSCCGACSDPRSPDCKLCDDRNGDCMQLPVVGFQCDRVRDGNCRCDSDGPDRKCCDVSPRCSTASCCQLCANPRDVTCNLCDNNSRDCMSLSSATSTTASCSRGEIDCICVRPGAAMTEMCCDGGPRCSGAGCCAFCRRGDPDCVCLADGNCVVAKTDIAVPESKTDVAEKAQRIMLDSCLRLSSSLLSYWTPDGERRPDQSKPTQADVKRELSDFFSTARCTKFDDDIQALAAEEIGRNDKVQDAVFPSFLGGVNAIKEKKKSKDTESNDARLRPIAEEVIANSQGALATS